MIRILLQRSIKFLYGSFASKVLTSFTFVLLARYISPSEFGNVTLYVTILTLTTILFDVGLSQWFQKKSHQHDGNELFCIMLKARTLMLALSLFVIIAISLYFNIFTTSVLFILLLNLIPEAYLSILDGYYLFKGEPIKVSLKNGLKMIPLFVLMLLLILQPRTLQNFDIFYYVLLSGSIFALCVLFPYGIFTSSKAPKSENFLLSDVIKESSSYALLLATSIAYARADHLVISSSLQTQALGIYGAAYRFLDALSLFPQALAQNLFPISSHEKGFPQESLKKVTIIMATFGGTISLLLWMFASPLILNLIGSEYTEAIPVLQIFAYVLFLFFINAPLATVVQSSHLVKNFLPWGVMNTILNIALNIAFVPVYGIQAAAYIMLLTEGTGFLINLYFIQLLKHTER